MRHSDRVDIAMLHLHRIVERLLNRSDADELFPVSSGSGPVEILSNGMVLTGTAAFRMALRARAKRIAVVRRDDLKDEDPVVVAALAIKDLLAGTTDPIALGAAWDDYNCFVHAIDRPLRGYRRIAYERQHGMSPTDRLRNVTWDTFGYGDDLLRRFADLLTLPPLFRAAVRDKSAPLSSLVELARESEAIIDTVLTDMRAGKPVAEAITGNLPAKDKRPAPRTSLRRLMRACQHASDELAGRVEELIALSEEERSALVHTRELIDQLLGLPSTAELLRDALVG